jgi:LPS sulfotransferase NodH
VDLKQAVNRVLNRATGYELRKIPGEQPRKPVKLRPGDRLVESPVFVLCTVRSGSTLLRVLLNSHSRIHAPHEMHLGDLTTETKSKYADRALKALDLEGDALRYLLWDRMLHRELAASGKDVLVYKNPRDVFIVEDLVRCWPAGRFVFLLRHPLSVARSRQALRPQDTEQVNLEQVLKYGNALEGARQSLEGLTVRYEELTADPEGTLQQVCSFIGVEWEPEMLDYGQFEHGGYRYGLGDRKGKIKSGRIQEPEPLPSADEIPELLRPLAEAWGYTGQMLRTWALPVQASRQGYMS